MPEITAQGKIFRDWEALLGACTQNAALLPGVDDLMKSLETVLAAARDLKVQQENFGGNRSATTQRLSQSIADGKEAARKLRAFVLIHLGSDSKQLTQFGVPPRHGRSRKVKPVVPTPPPTPAPEEKATAAPKPADPAPGHP